MREVLKIAACCAALATPCAAQAAALRVSPILIDAGSENAAAVTLRNQDPRPMNAQVRVYRWTQRDGQDELTPTDDVVASPPILSVAPNEDYTIRLQRVADHEPAAEEAYRVVIDELPNPNRQRNGTVAIVLRYVVPAFYFPADTAQPRLRWSLGQRGGHVVLIAENTGEKRAQIVDLGLQGGGHTRTVVRGLAGYVLGHSIKEWALDGAAMGPGRMTVVATSDHGVISAPLAH